MRNTNLPPGRRPAAVLGAALFLAGLCAPACAWELAGRKTVSLHTRDGQVLTLGTVAFQPAPFMSTYGATKAFVLSFTEALWAEYRERGLRVVAVCPGPVDTPFIDAMGSSARTTPVFRRTLTVDKVVNACLAALESSAPTRVVGWRNWLSAQSSRLSPRALTARIGAGLLRPR